LCLLIYQIFEIINNDEVKTALEKFDIADKIFDLDDIANKIMTAKNTNTNFKREDGIILHVLTTVIQDMTFMNDLLNDQQKSEV
jgi:hypothetical protein